MLKAALFSDGTREYRIPEEPECGENVKIRFRTGAGDVDHVYAVIRDGGSAGGWSLRRRRRPEDLIFMRERSNWGRPR